VSAADKSNVVILDVVTCLPIPVERILNAALEADLDTVMVVGYDKNGKFYFAGSDPSAPNKVWLLEMGIHKQMQVTIDDE